MAENNMRPIVKRLESVAETAEAAAKLAGILREGDLLCSKGKSEPVKRLLFKLWPKALALRSLSPVRLLFSMPCMNRAG